MSLFAGILENSKVLSKSRVTAVNIFKHHVMNTCGGVQTEIHALIISPLCLNKGSGRFTPNEGASGDLCLGV